MILVRILVEFMRLVKGIGFWNWNEN